jgi:SNF2 family DNA or RNA helicase
MEVSCVRMYAYQTEAVEWMKLREQDMLTPGGFLCHEMGLGKTHMMSALIDSNAGRTLLLTTKSTLQGWADTLRTYSKFKYDVRILDTEWEIGSRPTVLISTHHSVFNHAEWYRSQRFDRIVVDEAHVMRNAGSMFRACVDIAATTRFRWGITGTPFNNKDSDMVAYMRFLRPDTPLPAAAFKHFFLRKLRGDVIRNALPLIVTKMVYDFESEAEKAMYDYVSGRIDASNDWIARNVNIVPWRQRGQMAATLSLRKRQAAIHPQLVLNSEKVWAAQMPAHLQTVGEWNPSNVTKANKIVELVKKDRKARKSTMIVTHFAEEMRLLKDRLIQEGITPLTLDGKTTVKARRGLETYNKGLSLQHTTLMLDSIMRQKTIHGLNLSIGEGEYVRQNYLPEDCINIIAGFVASPTVILLQIQAGGVGISLPWVHHVINASPDWNPFLEQQSIYRAYRVNTPHPVSVTSMYFRDTIDVTIQERQKQKMERAAEWLGDSAQSISAFVAMPA